MPETTAPKALVRIELDGEKFEIYKLTLGEGRLLKREFGLADLSTFNLADPDTLTGMLSIATKRKHPDWSDAEVMAHVETLDFFTLKNLDEENPEPDPQNAATVNADDAEHGGQGTSLETPGTQASGASTV